MGTTTNTNTSNQYNPASINAYNTFQPQLMSTLQQMAMNPLGNSFFQHQLAQQQMAGQQLSQRNISNSLQNARTGGGILSNSGGFTQALMARNNVAASGIQSNAFNSAMNQALQNRNSALVSMQSYQPLQTGQKTSQSTGGVGTWLGPIAGAAMNMMAPGVGSMLGGGTFKGGYQANPYSGGGGGGNAISNPNLGSAPANWQNPFNSPPPPSTPTPY